MVKLYIIEMLDDIATLRVHQRKLLFSQFKTKNDMYQSVIDSIEVSIQKLYEAIIDIHRQS